MLRLRPVTVALLVAASCGPKLDGNGSNPDGAADLTDLYANDPALSYDIMRDQMVLAYDDEAGAFDADTGRDVLVPRANPSRAGISTSHDHGKSWERVGAIPPAGPGCGDPRCAVSVAGSGAVAPMESGNLSFWAGLAYTDVTLPAPDAVVVSSSGDGAAWTPARVTGWLPDRVPGEPSLGRAGNSSVIAFTDRTAGRLYFVPFDGSAPSSGPPYLVPIVRDDEGIPKAHPIVRLYSGLLGYVAYLLPRDEQGTTFDLRVAMLSRQLTSFGLTPWQALVAFHLDDVAIDPTRAGALGRTWRDAAPIGLALGNGPWIHLVYRQLSSRTGRSQVFLVECDASSAGSCAIEGDGTNSSGWTITALDDLLPAGAARGAEYRPTVGADPYSSAVAYAWLEETQPGAAEVTAFGTSSANPSGLELSAPTDLTGGHPWTPCPTAGQVGADAHSYGSHDATALLPLGPGATVPAAVTGYVDSSLGCRALGQLTFDQHVQVTPW